jgi:hypothetical protein
MLVTHFGAPLPVKNNALQPSPRVFEDLYHYCLQRAPFIMAAFSSELAKDYSCEPAYVASSIVRVVLSVRKSGSFLTGFLILLTIPTSRQTFGLLQ